MTTVETHARRIGGTSKILPMHKPTGITSRSVVDEVQSRCDVTKIGHGGTLDPLAKGVLPLHLNEATKVVEYLRENPKSYRVRCRFDLRSRPGTWTNRYIPLNRINQFPPGTNSTRNPGS